MNVEKVMWRYATSNPLCQAAHRMELIAGACNRSPELRCYNRDPSGQLKSEHEPAFLFGEGRLQKSFQVSTSRLPGKNICWIWAKSAWRQESG